MSYYVAMASLDVYKDQSCCCLLTAGVVDMGLPHELCAEVGLLRELCTEVGLPRQLCTQVGFATPAVGLPRQLFTSSCSLFLTFFLPG